MLTYTFLAGLSQQMIAIVLLHHDCFYVFLSRTVHFIGKMMTLQVSNYLRHMYTQF